MSRRPTSLSRHLGDGTGIPFRGSLNPKSRPSPFLSISLVLVWFKRNIDKVDLSRLDGGVSCSVEIKQALPYLKKAYADSMHKVLHMGLDSCSMKVMQTAKALQENGLFVLLILSILFLINHNHFLLLLFWMLLTICHRGTSTKLFHNYQEYLQMDLLFSLGILVNVKSKWLKCPNLVALRNCKALRGGFDKLEENEVATKKFELAAPKKAYQSTCQIFHLKSLH
uniref:Uncharacterized protein n=1 Tax=Lactuca sativa TaxID=4236 RepID=A0A9R1UY30_LACSA|nr:hypothetical protein LSAT_V11C700357310 [Lactuca sativa]